MIYIIMALLLFEIKELLTILILIIILITSMINCDNLTYKKKKPNIILFLTDDQDIELGSLNFMPKTLKNIREKGVEFHHAYVTTPMCCPSRSSLLTGMFVHNHEVFTNKDNCSSPQWQLTHETKNFATYLSNAGYRTGYFGKYLNKYNGTYIPPGWREWGGLIMNSKYYNYSRNLNGQTIKHGYDYDKDYYTNVVTKDALNFLRNSKKHFPHKPFMLMMAFPAPHGPEDSAPKYSKQFFNVTTHHTPSYNFAPNPDKQWILKVTGQMEPYHKDFTNLLMTKRLQTLQSVDDSVETVIRELKELNEIDDSFIFYTSDHGYHLGQFGLIKGKSFPFEFDVRVPFLIRGPGIKSGTTLNDIVLNLDLAPTFLDLAGIKAPPQMDGKSIVPLLFNRSKNRKINKWRDTFLIESSGRRETPYLNARQEKHSLLQFSVPNNTKIDKFHHLPSSDHDELINQFFKDLENSTRNSHKNNHNNNHKRNTNFKNIELFEDNNTRIKSKFLKRDHGRLNFKLSAKKRHHLKRASRNALRCILNSKICRHNKRFCRLGNGKWSVNHNHHQCKDNNKTLLLPSTASSNHKEKNCVCFTSEGTIFQTDKFNSNIKKNNKPENFFPFIDNDGVKYCYCGDEEATNNNNNNNNEDIDEDDDEEIIGTALIDNESITQVEKHRLINKRMRKKDDICHHERMTCFEHNNDHWRTEPKWTGGSFCFCMNSNNNTYSCLRTINFSHNFLYCEFTTGYITFYNLRIDPFELQNRYGYLHENEKNYLHNLLKRLIACKGTNCIANLDTSFRLNTISELIN